MSSLSQLFKYSKSLRVPGLKLKLHESILPYKSRSFKIPQIYPQIQ